MAEQIQFDAADARQFIFDDAPLPESTLPILDRSTLEAYATCPFQAHAIETGKVQTTSDAAASGEEVHKAITATIQEYLDQMAGDAANVNRPWVCEVLEMHLANARPDVQPSAIAGARASVWSFADFLCSLMPTAVLHFDGGEGSRNSQLAVDFPGMCRATSELDLVTAGPSADVLHLTDWKSGWTPWSTAKVAESFQFQMHAMLLFDRYPGIKAVEVTVWDLRRNKRTYPVTFPKDREDQYIARVRMAAEQKLRYGDNPPAFPTLEKCPACCAAHLCPEADDLTKLATAEPGAVLEQYIATDARLSALEKHLKAALKARNGEPIVSGTAAFGPKKSTRAPTVGVYAIEAAEESEAAE